LIPTDSNFSPVVRVAYSVSENKKSKLEVTDTLTITVVTNGAIKPLDAISYAGKILEEYLKPLVNLNVEIAEKEILVDESKTVEKKPNAISIQIVDLNLSARSYNCLREKGIRTVQELTGYSKDELESEQFKNLGKKSVKEIVSELKKLGLQLKSN
jgi:DNA-directed RNA polymerase subunit alpha